MASILVVDDEPALRAVIRRVLERAGHAVLEAVNGAEGLTLYEAQRPDLVITDLMMPGGDGFAFLRDLRGVDPEVGVLVMTASHRLHEGMLDLALKVGAAATIEKPFRSEELLKIVSELLGKGDGGPGLA